ncbi:neuropeptide Y receptor Y2, like [Hippocampus zosterae]|uniref:neuropeptide Y receptor Y2, like n=1 Tax=Hippocampus zosterae TaxID=109293 RepID=UPI00223D40BA|nr:neuropeptide Y receptor Y2, like [Hippocampus zosterae]XP_051920410.1 neuropeptide Y receptor Y2, like [Hippocampus zosterae]
MDQVDVNRDPPTSESVNLSYHDDYDDLLADAEHLGFEGGTFPEDPIRLLGVQVVLIAAYSAIILLGLVGNSLVIYVIYRFKTLRTVTNFFIANLAVADLLVNALCLPFTLVYTLQGEWQFGSTLCFLVPFAQGLAVHVSTLTLNVIALDRHRCIIHHLETRMRKDTCYGVIALTWLMSAALASPLAIFREYGSFALTPGHSIQVCTEKWPGSSTDGTVYSVSMLVLQYFLPLAIISFAYARIWSKLRGHVSPAEGGADGAAAGSQRHRRRRKTTKMLVTMVVVFAVSWLPYHAFQLATDIDSTVLDMPHFRLLYTLFHVVAMCSTFANPLLYGWMNRNYRAAFLAAFKLRDRGCGRGREDSIRQLNGEDEGRTKREEARQEVACACLNATDV